MQKKGRNAKKSRKCMFDFKINAKKGHKCKKKAENACSISKFMKKGRNAKKVCKKGRDINLLVCYNMPYLSP